MVRRTLFYAVGWSLMLIAGVILVVAGSVPVSGSVTRVPTPTITPTPQPGSIEGYVFLDTNRDGKWNSVLEPGLLSVRVYVQTGVAAQTNTNGGYKLRSLPPQTYKVQVELPPGYTATTPTERTVKLAAGQRVTGQLFGLILTSTQTPTPTPTESPTSTVTVSATPTETPTQTPTATAGATASPTETPSVTPTPTMCPVTTPELLWVEPVISPTDLLTQTLIVHIGKGDAITVTLESGVFTSTGEFGAYGNPASVALTLLPDTLHHLQVQAHVRRVIAWGGCVYGDYTLGASYDRNGAPLVIQQVIASDTATPTVTPSPTATSASRRIYLPLVWRP